MKCGEKPVASRAAAAASRAAATATCPRSACSLPRRCSCSCGSSCSRPCRVRALHAAQALDTSKCTASEIVVGRPAAWAANAPGPSDGSDRRPRAPAHARSGPRVARDCPMQDPHISLHIARLLLVAPGRVAAHAWHGQTRLNERFHLRCERSPPVAAVASAGQERAQLPLLPPVHTGRMHACKLGGHPSRRPRAGWTALGGGRDAHRTADVAARRSARSRARVSATAHARAHRTHTWHFGGGGLVWVACTDGVSFVRRRLRGGPSSHSHRRLPVRQRVDRRDACAHAAVCHNAELDARKPPHDRTRRPRGPALTSVCLVLGREAGVSSWQTRRLNSLN